MKSLFITLFLFATFLGLQAQNKYSGEWHDYEASDITINVDGSFRFTFRFDLISSWANGTYKVNKDTLYFTWIPIFDTLRLFDSVKNTWVDSFIVSEGQIPKLLTKDPGNLLASGGQSKYYLPKKLYYHKEVLYDFNVETGKMLTKKYKPLWGSKKMPAGYHKKIKAARNYIYVN
jgi:hypothetical protein